MPIYFDLHPPDEVPLELIRQGIADVREGGEDQHHVRQVDYYCCVRGAIYCVLVAPGPEAVCARHAERGLPCQDVRAVAGLEDGWPLSAADRQVLNQAIVRDWEARQAHTSAAPRA